MTISPPASTDPSVAAEAPWARPAEDVLAGLGVDPKRGLGPAEVDARRRRHGRNLLRETRRTSSAAILVRQFRSLVVALLAAACVVSLAFGQWLEGGAVAAVLAVNALIGFVTELRAVRSMEALRKLGRATARVLRGGRGVELPAVELVPGDIVLLEAGDVVTADLRLVQANKLEADESMLTGESLPVPKASEAVEADAPLAERRAMLFKGTALTRGSGLGVVVATGMATELGRIASLAQKAESAATPLERRLEQLGRRLVWVALGVALVTTAAGVARGKDLLLMIETGIALAVAAIPEGLPIVATLALARGMWRMARHHALINRLSAVETLGATSVILSDKTGTLTENRMTAALLRLPAPSGAPGAEAAAHAVDVGGRGLTLRGDFTRDGQPLGDDERGALHEALEVGVLCNNATLRARGSEGEATGDPMEVALLVAAAKAGLQREDLVARWPERREEAFDPTTRAMATFHADAQAPEAGYRVAVKGAAEALIEAAAGVREHGRLVSLDDEGRGRWRATAESLAAQGLRVLGLATRRAATLDEPPYRDLELLALVGLHDPPREEVRRALQDCRDAGLRVVMVTGDQAGTALAVARSLGLVGDAATVGEHVIEGRQLPRDSEWGPNDRARLLDVPVFARVEPEQKLRLIELHQRAGAVVAMTGDGVNDAPALGKADIGVAMGRRGTQVAREAADMVLQDDSFESIVRAVRQGRVIFTNIRRFVLYLLSCNVSEILIVLGASLAAAPLPVLPLQILYLNLVTDVFPALALGFGEGDPGVMSRPPRRADEPIVTRRHWRMIGAFGVLIAVCVLGALGLAIEWLGLPPGRAVTISFLTLAFAQLWHVFDMRDAGSRVLANDVARNAWVWGAVALCTALLVAAVHWPLLARVLGTSPPGAEGWALALGLSLVPLLAGQIVLSRTAPQDVERPVR